MMAVLILSCDHNDKKDEEQEPEIEFIKPPIDCLKKKRTLDSLGTAQALIGKWQWKYASCGWRDPSDEVFEGVEVTFFEDGTMTITGDGEPRTASWTLKRNVSGERSVRPRHQTGGSIFNGLHRALRIVCDVLTEIH